MQLLLYGLTHLYLNRFLLLLCNYKCAVRTSGFLVSAGAYANASIHNIHKANTISSTNDQLQY